MHQLWRSVKEAPERLQDCLERVAAAQQSLKEGLMRLEMELVEQLDVGPVCSVLCCAASDTPLCTSSPGHCQGV